MNIGQRIKEKRKELGLSVDDVASKLNKNRATVYRYESNDIENLSITILEPLAKILKTTPAYLMGWDIEKEKIVDAINPMFKAYKENKEFFNNLSSRNEESLEKFNDYLYSTFSNEINTLGDNFTAMDILTLFEYVNKIISFELSKIAEPKKEISEIKNNVTELITANKQKFEDKPHLMPIASHDKEGTFTKEDIQHDDDIMNDDDFWNK